jgi:hypothetical protein
MIGLRRFPQMLNPANPDELLQRMCELDRPLTEAEIQSMLHAPRGESLDEIVSQWEAELEKCEQLAGSNLALTRRFRAIWR